MTKIWILLSVAVSVSGYFLLKCQCNDGDGTDLSEIFTYAKGNKYESSESSSCETCEELYQDDNMPPPSPSPDPWIPPNTGIPSIPLPRGPLQCSQDTQNVDNQTIIWPDTQIGAEAVSEPLCLDKYLMIMKRRCEDNWEPPPTCARIQQPIDPCPSDLTFINGRYCYTIVENTTFPPNCPYPGPLGWDVYSTLDLFPREPVWMPVKRNNTIEHGIDLFRFTEITDNYKIPFQICTRSCRTFSYEDTFVDKECQVYHNDTHIEAVNCDAEYSAVCMYDAISYQHSSLCQQTHAECKQGGYSAESICFCETTSQMVGEQALAEFIMPYQNLLFSNSSCRIGLQNTFYEFGVPFNWAMSNISLNYTYWSPNVDFNYPFAMMTSNGWMLNDGVSNCLIYQVEVPIAKGQLHLTIEEDFYKLTITNYKSFLSKNNIDPLVHCFTDADAKSIIFRVNNFTEFTTDSENYIMKFSPVNLDQFGPGQYWCQAFLYPDLRVITSNARMIYNFNAEYVVLLRLNHYDDRLSSYPLTSENLETLQNLFKNELPNGISFYPRIFKINRIDEAIKSIDITFHLTSSEASSTEEEYDTLKNISMGQSMFEFLDFRNVHYCPSTTTEHEGQTIIWPLIIWNKTTYPLGGHCVTNNATLIQRTCDGNFVDGVYWSVIVDTCQFYPASSLTDKIITISGQSENDGLIELSKISEEYNSFNTLDFVLTTLFIKKISCKKPDLDVLAGIVNNLMKISGAALLSSQLNFKATDILLESLDVALENGELGEWKKPNFAVKSIDITNGVLGFLLQNCTNNIDCDLVAIKNATVVYDRNLIVTQKIEAAISLSSELYDQIIAYSNLNESYTPKLIISIYYGSQLFIELENLKSSNLVFGVLLPDFTEEFKGPVSIYYYATVKSNLLEYNCSYWKFSDVVSSWATENTEELNEAIACEFYHITNFGIPFTELNDEVISTEPRVNENSICIPDDDVTKKCFNADQYNDKCTVINQIPLLNEYCLTNNFTFVSTKCFENFTGEAYVSDIADGCTVYQMSLSLKLILEMVEEASIESLLNFVFFLTEKYESINDVELLFVISCMNMFTDKIKMSLLAGIVNNIMNVPSAVLYSAQRSFRAIDKLLSTIEAALALGECGEWITEKFAIKCLMINEGYMGVLVKNCSKDYRNCNLQAIHNTYQPSTINNEAINGSFFGVVALSDVLYYQILHYSKTNSSYVPKLMISVYFGSELFVDMEVTYSASNLVFGALLPNFYEKFRGPLLIYYLNGIDFVQYNCSYWKLNESSYGSWEIESVFLSSQTAICKFFHLSNFAMPTKLLNGQNNVVGPDLMVNKKKSFNNNYLFSANSFFDPYNIGHNNYNTNITIPHILDDSMCSSEEIKRSGRFLVTYDNNKVQQFTYLIENVPRNKQIVQLHDINNVSSSTAIIGIISETLQNMIQSSEITLELLADFIDFCMDLNENYVLEAQISFQFADKMVHAIDKILQEFTTTSQVSRKNIVIMTISKEDMQNFQGFLITKNKDVICIFQEQEVNEINVDVVVTISEGLLEQIIEAKSSIIFTIFYNQSLFPVKYKTRVKLPIIEVLIPNLHESFRGDISIKYKNAFKGKCSYWNYEIEKEKNPKLGSWQRESQALFDGHIAACNFQHVTHFALVASSQNITTNLEQILASNLTALEKLTQVETITTTNHNYLVPVDIYLISQIITNSLSEGAIPVVITGIISSLFRVPRQVLRESQEFHSATDIILYAVEEMSRMVNDLEVYNQNFSVIVKNLDSVNLTGIVLHSCSDYICIIDELNQFVDISKYTSNSSISAMVIFSEDLLKQIRNNTSNPKVAVSVYHSNVLFNEISNERNTTMVFGILFPELTNILDGTVSVIYNIGITSANDSNQCAYWNYNRTNATPGEWVNDTNSMQRANVMAICNYSHVTHFGMLLANNDENEDDYFLDLITDIGCVLSLFGVLIIVLTAMLFKKWRQNTGNKILINFSIAISIKIITLYVSVYVKSTSSGFRCAVTGILLHYAILSECAWMLTVAILQFKRFVEVLGGPPKYVLVKALICGWVFPLIPVICVVTIDHNNYERSVANLCYPSNLGLYLGVWLPVLLILTINFVIFTFIIYNVFHKKTECIESSNQEILFQWRLALLLFFMLGLNWGFGFLGQIKGDILFTYLYSITASLQGFVLFLFFIVFNKTTRFLYSQSIKNWFYSRGMFRLWQSKSKPLPKN